MKNKNGWKTKGKWKYRAVKMNKGGKREKEASEEGKRESNEVRWRWNEK